MTNNNQNNNTNKMCKNCNQNVVFSKLSELVGKDLEICTSCLESFMRDGNYEHLTQVQIDAVVSFINEAKEEEKAEYALIATENKGPEQELKSAAFGRDLNKLAREGKIDKIIGREKEIEETILILSRKYKPNPLLVGEPGVGKTAIIEGIAKKIVDGDVPYVLRGKRILEINVGDLVAGTKYRGEFEARIKSIIDEVKKEGNVLLFFDEFHSIMETGGAEGAVDAANILKPAIARGDIQIIGATTYEEYRKHIMKDGAFSRRMQVVDVKEPTEEETVEIIEGLKVILEDHHKVKIEDETIQYAVKLAGRYLREKFQPDKSIDLLDEACSLKKITKKSGNVKLYELEKIKENATVMKNQYLNEDRYQEAKDQLEIENKLELEIEVLRGTLLQEEEKNSVVKIEHINMILERKTGIPVTELTLSEKDKIKNLDKNLKNNVKGQEKAINEVSRFIRRSKLKLKDPNRPTGVFLFLGPTGVGKTELAKTLANELFGSKDAMVRFDMSEFMEKHSTSKLIGSPPGYVGHDDGGKLTNALRRRPYSLVLFDEIEKAHPDVLNVMLQVFEDGVITDSKGKTVDARNSVFIMTSNAGSQLYSKGVRSLGFSKEESAAEANTDMETKVKELIKKQGFFKPEFLNRIDSMIAFNPLDAQAMLEICDKLVADLELRVESEGYKLTFSEEAKDLIKKTGYSPEFGAREMKRIVEGVTDLLTDSILLKNKKKYRVIIKDEKLFVE
jgi:ATP-dependent Clp protease ATP-binding subunit ClpC